MHKEFVSFQRTPRRWVLLHELGWVTEPVSKGLLQSSLLTTPVVLYLLGALGLTGSRALVLSAQRHGLNL